MPHHGVEYPPGAFGLVGPDEQRWVAEHQVEEKPLVGIRGFFEEGRTVEQVHVHRADLEAGVPGTLAPIFRETLIWLDSDDEHVRREALGIVVRKGVCGEEWNWMATSVAFLGSRLPALM